MLNIYKTILIIISFVISSGCTYYNRYEYEFISKLYKHFTVTVEVVPSINNSTFKIVRKSPYTLRISSFSENINNLNPKVSKLKLRYKGNNNIIYQNDTITNDGYSYFVHNLDFKYEDLLLEFTYLVTEKGIRNTYKMSYDIKTNYQTNWVPISFGFH